MHTALVYVRSVLLWTASLLHFGSFAILLLLLRMLFDHRKFNWLVRIYFHNIQFLSGMKVRYVHAGGFDPRRTSIFVSNHVNLFDPFVLYNGIPQFVRGMELESHFEIPFYGWLMHRFGNVPVPDARTPAALKRLFRLTQQALDEGTSLVIFPEGHRTLDGRVDRFEDGAFVLAQKFKCPLVPISIVGSFQHNHKHSWLLRPARITVYIHDSIETAQLTRADLPALRDRVRETVAGPVHEHMRRLAPPAGPTAEGREPSPEAESESESS